MSSSSLTEVFAQSWLLNATNRAEFAKWGHPMPERDETQIDADPQQLARDIERVLESESFVLAREADLEALPAFRCTLQDGDIHFERSGEMMSLPLKFGTHPSGEVLIIPDEELEHVSLEFYTDGITYIEHVNPESNERYKTYFSNVREIYFGKNVVFLALTPAKVGTSP